MTREAVRIKNFNRALKEFEGLEKKVQKKIARKATRAGAKLVHKRTRQLAPEDEEDGGQLKKGIKVRAMKRSRKLLSGHTVQIELKVVPYASFQELGTRYIEAQRFMLEAAVESQGKVSRTVRRHFLGGIKRIARESRAK